MIDLKYKASDESTADTIAAAILGFPIVVAVTAVVFFPLAILRGFVLMMLWGWYVVPLFHLPSLTIAYAYGLGLLASYAIPSGDRKPSWGMVVYPVLVLLFGWIGTWFL